MRRFPKMVGMSLCALAATLLCAAGFAADVVEWRNGGNAVYPDATPPVAWSTTQNVAWSTALPPKGNASPLIVGDKVITTAEPDQAVCLDKTTGKILWQKASPISDAMTDADRKQAALDKPKADAIREQMKPLNQEMRQVRGQMRRDRQNQELRKRSQELRRQIGALKKELAAVSRFEKPPTHGTNGYASPSPTTDGENLYFVFGTGVIASYDLGGSRRWIARFDVPDDNSDWGFSTSPLIAEGKLLVHGTQLRALDPATGKEIWTTDARWSWGTPAIVQIGGKAVVVTSKGDFVRVADGKILARRAFDMPWGGPVAVDGVIYAVDQKGCKALEIPVAMADTLHPKVLWSKSAPVKDRYYATSLISDGLIYNIAGNGKKTLVVMDAKTGDTVYTEKMPFSDRRQYGTISLAGGNLYVASEGGEVIVFKPGRAYEQVGRNSLEEFRSTPTFQGDRVYIRTEKHLFCLKK